MTCRAVPEHPMSKGIEAVVILTAAKLTTGQLTLTETLM